LQDANLDALSRKFSVPHCEALVFILVFHSIATPILKAAAKLSAANILIDSMLWIDAFPLTGAPSTC
jgi:hypothetical protein